MISTLQKSGHPWLRSAIVAFGLLAARTGVAETEPSDDAARAKARVLAYAGVEAYAVGDYAAANEGLDEAYSLLPVPSLGLWSARSFVKLGKLLEAEARYRAVSALRVGPSDPPVQQSAQQDAARELEDLLPKIPTLELELSGASAAEVTIEIDGVRLSGINLGPIHWVNPGRHSVVGTRGSEKSEVILNMGEGAHERVRLRFSPARKPDPALGVVAPSPAGLQQRTSAPLRTVGWVALTAGGAGLTTGVVAYLVGRGMHENFVQSNSCANGACSQADVDVYNTWRTLHLAGLISGGVLAATGVSLLLLTSGDAAHSGHRNDMSVRLAPGSLTVQGAF